MAQSGSGARCRSRSESRRQKWTDAVRSPYAAQKEAASGMMRSSRLSSVNHSSVSRRGSLPHVTSNTSSYDHPSKPTTPPLCRMLCSVDP